MRMPDSEEVSDLRTTNWNFVACCGLVGWDWVFKALPLLTRSLSATEFMVLRRSTSPSRNLVTDYL